MNDSNALNGSDARNIILIVDDEPMGRDTLEALLYAQGYQLEFATNGLEALEKAAQLMPDLILLDVMMPGMTGFDVCQRLRADPDLREVPVIMVTALDDSESRIRGLEAGADDFLNKPINRSELRARVRTITRLNRYRRLHEERAKFKQIFDLSPNGIVIVNLDGEILLANRAVKQMLRVDESEDRLGHLYDYLTIEQVPTMRTRLTEIMSAQMNNVQWQSKFQAETGRAFPVDLLAGSFTWDGKPAVQIVLRDITERLEAEARINQQVEILRSLFNNAQKLTKNLAPQALADDIVRSCVDVLGVDIAWLGRVEHNGKVSLISCYPPDNDTLYALAPRWDDTPAGLGNAGQAIRSAAPIVTHEIEQDADIFPILSEPFAKNLCTSAAFPLISHEKLFGVLNLYSKEQNFFTEERSELFQTYAHQVATAMENARLFSETEKRLQQIRALRRIDKAIMDNPNLEGTLAILLEQVSEQLGVEAASILLYDHKTQRLNFSAGRGFHSGQFRPYHLALGEGMAGKAAQERQTIHADAHQLRATFGDEIMFAEGFSGYYGVPLIAKDQLQGVLEVFFRRPINPTTEWLEFMETLAGQAAIAIDNATLFDDLQRSNRELAAAYEATLEGWVRALDLRDRETQGHTQRVTKMTLELARTFNFTLDELIHLKRGALLHDIGKMGIPDSILNKPGPLSPDEWEIMRRHPIYAHRMLSSIDFLRPALDIPHYHHERWDGTGYPHRLRGPEIPLAARLFAVIDVWDALTSDRPYRNAWSQERVLDYIKSKANKDFDPEVVDLFVLFIRSQR